MIELLPMSHLKYILIFCVVFGSCTKPQSVAPSSTFSISLNGKTINDTSSATDVITVTCAKGIGSRAGSVSVAVSGKKLHLNIDGAWNASMLYTEVGTYWINSPGSIDSVKDKADPGKTYSMDSVGGSTITVARYSAAEITGTFSITLRRDGVSYPANGYFDFKR
jgi:hypothetical protein